MGCLPPGDTRHIRLARTPATGASSPRLGWAHHQHHVDLKRCRQIRDRAMEPEEAGANIRRNGPGAIGIDHIRAGDRRVAQRAENLRRGGKGKSQHFAATTIAVPIRSSSASCAPKPDRLLGEFLGGHRRPYVAQPPEATKAPESPRIPAARPGTFDLLRSRSPCAIARGANEARPCTAAARLRGRRAVRPGAAAARP